MQERSNYGINVCHRGGDYGIPGCGDRRIWGAQFDRAFQGTPGSRAEFQNWCAVSLLFAGSLYLLALTGNRKLGAITPLGGLTFLAGWLLLILGVLQG
jgi:uncharacterized protein DUF423